MTPISNAITPTNGSVIATNPIAILALPGSFADIASGGKLPPAIQNVISFGFWGLMAYVLFGGKGK